VAVIGEIGYWRREIAFVGDVLNTTSRIMGECKNFNRSVLISEDLAQQFAPDPQWNLAEVGTVVLRGKQQEMKLFGIN